MKRVLCLFLWLGVLAAFSQQVDTTTTGFMIQYHCLVSQTPDQAFETFVQDIGKWWNGNHTYTTVAENMHFRTETGGGLYETLEGDGWVEHLSLVYHAPGKELRLAGGLGPLQHMAVSGIMTVTFEGVEIGTKVNLVYKVNGEMGLGKWGGPVGSVLKKQFDRYETYCAED